MMKINEKFKSKLKDYSVNMSDIIEENSLENY